jgi:hypothetical protein
MALSGHCSQSVYISETWSLDESTKREYSGGMFETVAAVIDALGGNAKVGALVGVGASAVSNWRTRGRIPAELFLVFSEALKGIGKAADPSLFGMAPAAEAQT